MRGQLSEQELQHYRFLYERHGRADSFFRMVLDDACTLHCADGTTILDVGCGDGFHHDKALQKRIGAHAQQFVGVEPDTGTVVASFFSIVHNSDLESANIPSDSVDLAYSAMVLEHIADPLEHFAALRRVLKPGGVFWGFTVDSRHFFALLSAWFERLNLKDLYLRRLHGQRGLERYANFPTHYRCNSPRTIKAVAKGFSCVQTLSLHKVGQLDFYLPGFLQGVSRTTDRAIIAAGLPGSILVVRLVK